MTEHERVPAATASALSFGVRLSWLFLGPLALFLIGAWMLREGSPAVSLPTVVFFGAVAVLVALRLLDVELLAGTTRDHEPATAQDVRSYSVWLIVAATLYWGLIQLVQWAER